MTILLASDLVDLRTRKRQELAFYGAELQKLLTRMSILNHEIRLTTTIIDMIEHEIPVEKRKLK